MKVSKIGHCCLVIETSGVKLLTDPGTYSTGQEHVTGLDAILITHNHQDHFHIESLDTILKSNASAVVVCNAEVAKIVSEKDIKSVIVDDGNRIKIKDVLIEGFGKKHEFIAEDWPLPENTGYFIDGRLYYPGDAFYHPSRNIEILALPVAGPWMKISESIKYAESVRPKISFPVHDGGLKENALEVTHRVHTQVLERSKIRFIPFKSGETLNL
ncbi:MAG: MBL fold metallo-hydrolase [Candidatus Taylorbacteria bacterium]|nr:MBL fold metallo-hydrolase [Candidatus Taylorbacteria bacterium]